MNETVTMPELRRIVLSLHENTRVILYPQGGLEVETFVQGPGWVLLPWHHGIDENSLADLLGKARDVVANAAGHFEV